MGPSNILATVTWRVASHQRSSLYGTRIESVAHALRKGRTLCGYTEGNIIWSTVLPDDAGRCSFCAQIPDGYGTARDMMDLGLTYRQVDFWCSRGFIRPDENSPGSGHRRIFPPEEFAAVAMAVVYLSAGLLPEQALMAARNGGWLSDRVRVEITD